MREAKEKSRGITAAEAREHMKEMAADLMELRRYVRTNMAHVRDGAAKVLDRILVHHWITVEDAHRIRANVVEGLVQAVADPLLLEGHLYGAARTIQIYERKCDRLAQDEGAAS